MTLSEPYCTNVLGDTHLRIDRCTTTAELFDALNADLSRLGAERFTFLAPTAKFSNPTSNFVSNYPKPWLERYIGYLYANNDVIRHKMETTVLPFTWNSAANSKPILEPERLILNEAREFKMLSGAAVGVRGPANSHGSLVISNSMNTAEFERFFRSMRNEFHLICLFAHEKMNALSLAAPPKQSVQLTPREHEILTWTAHGKSAWEIGQILSISEATAKEHIRNVCRKFGVRSKTHAVAIAVRNEFVAL